MPFECGSVPGGKKDAKTMSSSSYSCALGGTNYPKHKRADSDMNEWHHSDMVTVNGLIAVRGWRKEVLTEMRLPGCPSKAPAIPHLKMPVTPYSTTTGE